MVDAPEPVALLPSAGDGELVFGGAFAVSLIYVSYAYTGWNAATYLTGELDNPGRTLPGVLAGGTLLVMVLYLALNYTFLRAAPMSELEGRLEVGHVAAMHIFGPVGADIMGVTLAVLLVSTVSAMVLAGPRVLHVIGEDYPAFRFLERKTPSGIPRIAILTQAALALPLHLQRVLRGDPRVLGIHAGAQQPARGGGHLRVAEARAGARATLPRLGIPGHAPRLPGAYFVDAPLHPARPSRRRASSVWD